MNAKPQPPKARSFTKSGTYTTVSGTVSGTPKSVNAVALRRIGQTPKKKRTK